MSYREWGGGEWEGGKYSAVVVVVGGSEGVGSTDYLVELM
jgi:hypothetical protein